MFWLGYHEKGLGVSEAHADEDNVTEDCDNEMELLVEDV